MKLIHIVGYAKTGKTSFIGPLIHRLAEFGEVAVVKHLGHHSYTLEEGKDTTLFYEMGAAYSIGIDEEKAVGAIRNGKLEKVLDWLCDAGVEIAIIEGFKQRPFPKIVLGDLEAENCVLRNPTVDEVITSLPLFEEYFTMQGLVKDLKRTGDMSRAGALLTFNGIVREYTGDERTSYLEFDAGVDETVEHIVRDMKEVPGILDVRFHHRKGRLRAGEDITYIAVLAQHRHEAFSAVSNAIDRMKRELHDVDKEPRGE